MRILSKISITFLLLFSIFYFLSSATPTYAASQSTPSQPTQYISPNTNSDVPNNLHNWTQNVMIEVMSALTCQLAGVDPINPKQSCLGIDQLTGKIGFLPKAASPADSAFAAASAKEAASAQAGGAIGFMGNMISALYTPPLHATDYFKDLASNFGISKKTYAASNGGTGFDSLSPLINIWSAFRNIVYLLLVIVFVIIGLAIMLRVKIDPRTVMTIQNQIPKIIVGILAVTFSFAIAGFLIDMMWVFIYLIFGIFNGIPGVDIQSLNPSHIQGQTAIGAAGNISSAGIWGITWHAGTSILGTVKNLLGLGLTDVSFMNGLIHFLSVGAGFFVAFFTENFKVIGFSVPGIQEAIKGGAAAGLVEAGLRTFIPFIIAYLIIFIALLAALFRLWFALLMAYVQILLAVVLAPFWIIGGIVPGSPISLTGWLKDIGANLLAFPVTLAMFMLGKVFTDAFGSTQTQGQFVPPLIGNPGETGLIGSLISVGIILMTPNVVNMLKAALKAPKIETGAGKAFGAAAGGPMEMFNKAGSFGFTLSGLSSVPLINKLPILKTMKGGGGHPPTAKG